MSSIDNTAGPVIAFHGGYCCGMKTIHTLGTDPDEMAPPIVKEPYQDSDLDQVGERDDYNMYNQTCPPETCLARVDRYLKYLDAVRPFGIIEICLTDDNGDDCNQLPAWEPLLLERGFKLVNSCYNSNSGNRVFVYHRNKDK